MNLQRITMNAKYSQKVIHHMIPFIQHFLNPKYKKIQDILVVARGQELSKIQGAVDYDYIQGNKVLELLCILTVVVDIQATQGDKIAQNLHTLKRKR